MEFGKVKVFFTIMLMVCLTDLITAKLFGRCELAAALLAENVPVTDVPMWICMASHESDFDSRTVNVKNSDGTWNHGLWQINDEFWVGRYAPGGFCGVSAEDVTADDIGPAVNCVRMILDEYKHGTNDGWLAWDSHSKQGYCRDDLSSYVFGCSGF